MSETPEIPPIAELTVNQAHQMICADYLETIARLVRRGAITGFEFMWNTQLDKPIGKFVADASVMIGPVETQIRNAITEFSEEQKKKISVTDLTEQLQDHEPCQGEAANECALCNTKLS